MAYAINAKCKFPIVYAYIVAWRNSRYLHDSNTSYFTGNHFRAHIADNDKVIG